MNKNKPVALLEENRAFGELSYSVKETYDVYMPYGSKDINRWLDNRQAAKHRKHLKELMIRCGCYDKNGFIMAQKTLLDTEKMKFQWPRDSTELKSITKQQLNWLLSGLKIEHKKCFKDIEISPENMAI